jgi:hypothetical protein
VRAHRCTARRHSKACWVPADASQLPLFDQRWTVAPPGGWRIGDSERSQCGVGEHAGGRFRGVGATTVQSSEHRLRALPDALADLRAAPGPSQTRPVLTAGS